MGSGRIFVLGWWRGGPVGTGRALVALQPGLEELRDPLEGRLSLGGGLGLVDLARVLTHGGEDNGSGWWLLAVVCWIGCRLS